MYVRGHSSQKIGDFFMEENYLTRSKIHTKALAVTMAMMVENGKADLMNYHDILHHWYKWIHINAPFYENLNYPSQGEHMEVTLAKLRTTFPAYTSYAKSLLNDLETIITLYNGNKDFFASLYKDRAILRRKMEAHLMEEEKKYKPEGETVNRRSKIDNELEAILCDYRHSRKFCAKLQELEDKYSITIDPDNTQRCFAAVAGSIANSKALCTQNGYIVYPSICMAIIGESGENKSQPIRWHSYA